MIRIDPTNPKRDRLSIKREKAGQTSAQEKSSFLATFIQTRREMVQGELQNLIDRIDQASEELENTMTFELLEKYRNLVRDFLKVSVGEAYAVDQKLSISQTGRTKVMVTVQKVNEELEQMMDGFMEQNRNLIDFMARVDKIRGLLIDLIS